MSSVGYCKTLNVWFRIILAKLQVLMSLKHVDTPGCDLCCCSNTRDFAKFLVIGPANWSNSAENLPEIVKMSTSPEYYSVCLIPCSFLRSQNGGIPEELFRHGSFLSFNNHRNPDRSQIRMFCVKFLVHRCLWLLTYILTIWSDRGVECFLKWKCTHHISSHHIMQ